VVIANADSYADTLARDGAVIASFAERRAEIARQLAAAPPGGRRLPPIEDDALLDEVTALVERPNVLVCQFEQQFLDVPQECLILTMKANQKYFPLLDAAGKLTNQFLVVSNISPADASAVIGGNERVVRPRLADAKFFFDQDRKKTLESRVPGWPRWSTTTSSAPRASAWRACAPSPAPSASSWAAPWRRPPTPPRAGQDRPADRHGGRVPRAAGHHGRLLRAPRRPEARSRLRHRRPLQAALRRRRAAAQRVGVVVALADKLETLVGMFGIGNLPTGDKDPFALRRHALGVIRMLIEKDLPLDL
jgi:glycyl-tRNA synthetase beta chain